MFKIAICDDENLFTEELKELISGYMMEKGLVFEIDTYSSGEALIELGIEVVRYTIVLLDINMEKIDGIKTAEMIRKVSMLSLMRQSRTYREYQPVTAARYSQPVFTGI